MSIKFETPEQEIAAYAERSVLPDKSKEIPTRVKATLDKSLLVRVTSGMYDELCEAAKHDPAGRPVSTLVRDWTRERLEWQKMVLGIAPFEQAVQSAITPAVAEGVDEFIHAGTGSEHTFAQVAPYIASMMPLAVTAAVAAVMPAVAVCIDRLEQMHGARTAGSQVHATKTKAGVG